MWYQWTETEVWITEAIVKWFLQDKFLVLNKKQLRKHINKSSKADPISMSKSYSFHKTLEAKFWSSGTFKSQDCKNTVKMNIYLNWQLHGANRTWWSKWWGLVVCSFGLYWRSEAGLRAYLISNYPTEHFFNAKLSNWKQ